MKSILILSILFMACVLISKPAFSQSGNILKEKFHWGIISQDTVYGYAGVVKVDNVLYLSGVTSAGDFPTQVKNVYTSLENNLKRFGASFQNVVKENLFTTSIDSMKKYSYVRKPFYRNDFPAASWIGIQELFTPDRMLEVELVAHLPKADPKLSLPQSLWPAQVLTGAWAMNTSRGQILETWDAGGANILNCKSYRITAQDTVLLESIQLIKTGSEVHYVSTVSGQNNGQPIKFTLTSSANNRYVFENPNHDFPKRIVYDILGKDIIHAWIDGGEQAKMKRSDFYYHRIR